MPRWTEEQFSEWCRKRDKPRYEDHAYPLLSSSEPQPAVFHEPLGQDQRKEEGSGRIGVSITGFRTRLLDPDNFAGGCKYAIDALRYANLIPGDRHDQIELTFRQVKVKTKPEERTIIELDLP